MRFAIPSEGFYTEGLIKSFQAGAKRFAVAPEFQLNFTVIKDSHSKNADMVAGSTLRAFWTGDFIDQGSSIDTTTIVDPVGQGHSSLAEADPAAIASNWLTDNVQGGG